MNPSDFVKYLIGLLLVIPLLQGCAGPAKYDVSKFGIIQEVGILGFSENEIEFWANIDRSSNMYSAAGANDSKARRFSKLYKSHLKDLYPKLQDSVSTSLLNHRINSTLIPVPRNTVGIAESQYTSLDEPLLIECKIHIGFVLVEGGIMPTATVIYKVLAKKDRFGRDLRLEKRLSIGYGIAVRGERPDIIAFPSKLYPDEEYVIDHPDEVAADLIAMAAPLGKATALTLQQSMQ